MSWPNSQTTNNLDNDADSPLLARPEIYNAVVALNAIIASRSANDGIASLGAGGKIPAGEIPNSLTSAGTTNITLSPGSGITTVEYALGLTAKSTAQLESLTEPAGTLAYCSNGDGGNACLGLSDGLDWHRISLGSLISST